MCWSSETVYCWSAVWPRITLVIFGCTTFRLMWCVSEVKMVIHTQAAMGVGGSKARDFIYIPGRDLASVCSVIEQMHFSHGESRVFTGCTRPCCQAQPLGWLQPNQMIMHNLFNLSFLSNVKVNRVVATSVWFYSAKVKAFALALLGPGRLMACRCPTSDCRQGGHLWVM